VVVAGVVVVGALVVGVVELVVVVVGGAVVAVVVAGVVVVVVVNATLAVVVEVVDAGGAEASCESPEHAAPNRRTTTRSKTRLHISAPLPTGLPEGQSPASLPPSSFPGRAHRQSRRTCYRLARDGLSDRRRLPCRRLVQQTRCRYRR
jgi:hypothetical protein